MLTAVQIVAGLLLLVLGGDGLVRGASGLAARFGIPPLVVGLTVVAFGTSAPELAVSLQSVSAGSGALAVGNVVGSNVFNVLVIVGLSAMVLPLRVSRRVVWVEVPIMIGFSTIGLVLALDGRIDRVDGAVLLVLTGVYIGWLVRAALQESGRSEGTATAPPAPWRAAGLALAGLALLLAGARLLVAGAITAATALGVDDVVIGLTIVAAGTSLPEVAASIAAAWRGEGEMAIGNVLGSNVFNMGFILGTTGIAAGALEVPAGVLGFDFIIMLATAVACLPIVVTGHTIARWEGMLFVICYVAYAGYLVMEATGHALLPHVRDALYFAVPLTLVTLCVLAARALWQGPRPQSPGAGSGRP